MADDDKVDTKTLTYANGTILTKKVSKLSEDWEVDNRSLADINLISLN